MMAPASDAEASEDCYKQKQFADDSFHGPNRLDYTGKVGARQMAEAAHAEMGDYEPLSCDIVDGGEGVIVGRKDKLEKCLSCTKSTGLFLSVCLTEAPLKSSI